MPRPPCRYPRRARRPLRLRRRRPPREHERRRASAGGRRCGHAAVAHRDRLRLRGLRADRHQRRPTRRRSPRLRAPRGRLPRRRPPRRRRPRHRRSRCASASLRSGRAPDGRLDHLRGTLRRRPAQRRRRAAHGRSANAPGVRDHAADDSYSGTKLRKQVRLRVDRDRRRQAPGRPAASETNFLRLRVARSGQAATFAPACALRGRRRAGLIAFLIAAPAASAEVGIEFEWDRAGDPDVLGRRHGLRGRERPAAARSSSGGHALRWRGLRSVAGVELSPGCVPTAALLLPTRDARPGETPASHGVRGGLRRRRLARHRRTRRAGHVRTPPSRSRSPRPSSAESPRRRQGAGPGLGADSWRRRTRVGYTHYACSDPSAPIAT